MTLSLCDSLCRTYILPEPRGLVSASFLWKVLLAGCQEHRDANHHFELPLLCCVPAGSQGNCGHTCMILVGCSGTMFTDRMGAGRPVCFVAALAWECWMAAQGTIEPTGRPGLQLLAPAEALQGAFYRVCMVVILLQ